MTVDLGSLEIESLYECIGSTAGLGGFLICATTDVVVTIWEKGFKWTGLPVAFKVTSLGLLVASLIRPKTCGTNHLTSLVRVISVYRTGVVVE